MLEEFNKCDLQFEDNELDSLVYELGLCFNRQTTCFVEVCSTIYKIWKYCKGNYWKAKDDEYYNAYKLLAKFGFDKKAVSRYKGCFEKFMYQKHANGDVYALFPEFVDFNPSKLFELLPLSQGTCFNLVKNKMIKPEMTVKEIRAFVKAMKKGTDSAETVLEDTTINEDEIPMAYDPKQKYEFKYFESMSKNQLLNMIWSLQEEYQKLKNNKEKKQNDTIRNKEPNRKK